MNKKDSHVSTIQKTHKNLRRKLAHGDDFDKVWKSHCSNKRLLGEYSTAMEQLAVRVWNTECDGKDRTEIRVMTNEITLVTFPSISDLKPNKWCREISVDYFRGGRLQTILEKDARRKLHYEKQKVSHFVCGENLQGNSSDASRKSISPSCMPSLIDKIKLLDVGSCYNPFLSMPEFETVAVDLAPANTNVLKCDFLSVEVIRNSQISTTLPSVAGSDTVRSISSLPCDYFHVVVFSLLLSYIPCPHRRWLMCKKAHQVLTVNGLLLIVTPDSSHQNRNANLMVKWKAAIERVGFQRIKYWKDRHLHFLAFRKVPSDFIWDKRKAGSTTLDILNIPQDFQDLASNSNEKEEEKSEPNEEV